MQWFLTLKCKKESAVFYFILIFHFYVSDRIMGENWPVLVWTPTTIRAASLTHDIGLISIIQIRENIGP